MRSYRASSQATRAEATSATRSGASRLDRRAGRAGRASLRRRRTGFAFLDAGRKAKLESAFGSIEAIVDDEMTRQKIPGFLVGIVVDGTLAYAKGFGFADVEKKTRPDADTVFRIGSITKSLTALAVLALRDDGGGLYSRPRTWRATFRANSTPIRRAALPRPAPCDEARSVRRTPLAFAAACASTLLASDRSIALMCERGGDLALVLALDKKDSSIVASYAFGGVNEGLCPLR